MTALEPGDTPDVGFTPTVAELLRRLVAAYGDHELVVTPTGRITYAEADRLSRDLARTLLADGFGRGSRIAFTDLNGPGWLVSWLAIARIGAIAMPLSTLFRPAELRQVLTLSGAAALITPSELLDRDQAALIESALPGIAGSRAPHQLVEAPDLRRVYTLDPIERSWADHLVGTPTPSDDPYFVAVEDGVRPADAVVTVFTSGTTAEPKAVLHSNGAFVRHIWNVADATDEPYGERIYAGMPFFWVGGLSTTIGTAMVRGSTLLCIAKPEPSAVAELLVRERCTHVMAWPTVFDRIAGHLAAVPADELPPCVTAPRLPPPPPGRRWAAGLGMTETLAAYILHGATPTLMPEDVPGAHGLRVPGTEYRIVDPETGEPIADTDEGEICVRGYSLMIGMLGRERHEYLDADGWYHTGDRGSLHGDVIAFTGRVKDLIKASGANVAPREVEAVVNTHPDVVTSVVVGVPDPEREEVVGAMIEARSGTTADVVAEGVLHRCREELSSYKVPRRILVVGSGAIPSLATGKPDLGAIRDALADPAAAVVG